MLYEEVIEVSERVILQHGKCGLPKKPDLEIVTGTTGEKVSTRRNLPPGTISYLTSFGSECIWHCVGAAIPLLP